VATAEISSDGLQPRPDIGPGIHVAPTHNPHLRRPQYDYIDKTTEYLSYKRSRGINGAILAPVAHTPAMLPSGPTSGLIDGSTAPEACLLQHDIFSIFHTLPIEHVDTPLHAFPFMVNKADTLTQSQMLKTADYQEFIASQHKEIKGLVVMGVFDIQPMENKPASARLLSAIWSYRCKRSPAGDILKYKSRICVDGSQQLHGRVFWEVYAPVVSWPTIHLLLLLSSILDLQQRQVDYTQAFPQAPLEDPVYMKIPQGWHVFQGQLCQHSDPTYQDRFYYIKLQRNLHGCKQAACNRFQHLTQGLLSQGFCQSLNDSCLFL
jgi:hypothetical protein